MPGGTVDQRQPALPGEGVLEGGAQHPDLAVAVDHLVRSGDDGSRGGDLGGYGDRRWVGADRPVQARRLGEDLGLQRAQGRPRVDPSSSASVLRALRRAARASAWRWAR